MKANHIGLTILTSCLILAAGCTKAKVAVEKKEKLITIQAGGTLGCEVDFPVALVYAAKHYPRWTSDDSAYWIHFVEATKPFSVDPIPVPPQGHGKSQQLDITGPAPHYYKYEIW